MSAKSRICNEYNERGNCSGSSDALKLEYKRLSSWLRRKSICSFVITIFSLESKPASREKEILRNINNSYSSYILSLVTKLSEIRDFLWASFPANGFLWRKKRRISRRIVTLIFLSIRRREENDELDRQGSRSRRYNDGDESETKSAATDARGLQRTAA